MTEIGVLLPTREAVMYGDGSGDPRPLVDLAVMAEKLGFDSVWAGDSLLARPRAEPLTLLATVAGATNRVKLGTGVLLASQRNAEQLAQAAATLDAVSGGRLILGIGSGPATPGVQRDHELVGADFTRRASRSIEVAQRVKELWRGDTDPDGRDVMYPRPATAGGPPVWYGGHGPRMLARTGAHLDGWLAIAPDPDRFRTDWAAVTAAAEAAGRDPAELTANAYLTVAIGEPSMAEAELREHSELYYGVPHEVIATQQASRAGTLDEVTDWLRSFVEAGARHLCVRIGGRDAAGQIEALAGSLDQLRS